MLSKPEILTVSLGVGLSATGLLILLALSGGSGLAGLFLLSLGFSLTNHVYLRHSQNYWLKRLRFSTQLASLTVLVTTASPVLFFGVAVSASLVGVSLNALASQVVAAVLTGGSFFAGLGAMVMAIGNLHRSHVPSSSPRAVPRAPARLKDESNSLTGQYEKDMALLAAQTNTTQYKAFNKSVEDSVLTCSITQNLMVDPVKIPAAGGKNLFYYFERSALTGWHQTNVSRNGTARSPMDNHPFKLSDIQSAPEKLKENKAHMKAVRAYVKDNLESSAEKQADRSLPTLSHSRLTCFWRRPRTRRVPTAVATCQQKRQDVTAQTRLGGRV